MATTRRTSPDAVRVASPRGASGDGVRPDHEVVVIGAGFSGIGAAIKLDESGFRDYLVLEQADGVGGAWHANTYPGVGVDIPSFSYSFSFERNPDWSRVYAPGAELKSYAEHCVDKYRLRSRIRLNTTVEAAEFDERGCLWRLHLRGGETLTARYVISATGILTQPKNPDIPGLDTFGGTILHTARWDHDHDLTGRRVGVIGTGASALQLIPVIAEKVEHLTVFQRTPIWVIPKLDAPLAQSLRAVLRHLPSAGVPLRWLSQAFVEAGFIANAHYHQLIPWMTRAFEALCREHLRRQVPDPVLRAKLTPDYGLGCKRPSFSNTYLRTFNRDHVELETTSIQEITPHGVRTEDGREHRIDTLVLATGFKVFESGNLPPFPIQGVGGVDLDSWWSEHRFQAYQGAAVPGFPNLFTILGPYAYNGASYFQLIENQMRHITRCLRATRERGATRIEITPRANDQYFNTMLGRRHRQIFFNNNCATANSYYFDKHGDVPFRPATSIEAHWQSDHFNLDDYAIA